MALDPENSLALRTSGFFLLHVRGDFQAALDAYNRGLAPLEKLRMLPEDFHNRARLHRIFGQYDRALHDHNRAIALAPDAAYPYASRAFTRRILGRVDLAIDDLSKAPELDRTWALQAGLWTWEMRMLRGEPGDREAAATALAQAQSAKTGNPLDQLYVDICRGELSAEQALTKPKNDRERFFAYYYLGAKALVDGRATEAEDWFKKCVAIGQNETQEFDLARWHLERIASH